MQVSVSGQNIEIGAALQTYVQERLEPSVKQYFQNAIHAHVEFSKRGHEFEAKINVNEGTKSGLRIRADGSAHEVHAAFDQALTRIEKQLRRYSRHLKTHNQRERADSKLLTATKFVIQVDEAQEAAHGADAPVIIAEKPEEIETLSVGEAVMRMDLASLPALLFINSRNGRMNVVYKRADGNISWVDPSESRIAS